jgi:hypothetical protein
MRSIFRVLGWLLAISFVFAAISLAVAADGLQSAVDSGAPIYAAAALFVGWLLVRKLPTPSVFLQALARMLSGLVAICAALLTIWLFWRHVVLGLRLAGTTVSGTLFTFSLYGLPAATVSWLGGWFAVAGDDEETRRVVSAGLVMGLLFLPIVFLLFFVVVPTLFYQDSNIAPIGGFLFAPLGFAIGALLGVLGAKTRRQ